MGDIKNNTMVLSPIGNIVKEHWCEIPQHCPNVVLDEYTIMPNHLHGIIIIKPTNNIVETYNSMSLPTVKRKNRKKKHFYSKIIR